MPISKENRVRVEFLSKMTATPRGPSSGRRLNGSLFSSAASASTSACSSGDRSSSRRKRRLMGSTRLIQNIGNAVRNSSICASVMTSGGASLITSGAAALTRNPASRAATSTGLAASELSTTPRSSPRPRTWSTSGWPSASMPCCSVLPSTSARPIRSSAANTPSTASAAAVQTGLPPKVLPCSPGVSNWPTGPTAMQAPIGSPPPSPFARVTMSGVMPSCWWAKKAPVRPIPVCTSSRTSRAPWRAVSSRAATR